jgi:hypothetical protein
LVCSLGNSSGLPALPAEGRKAPKNEPKPYPKSKAGVRYVPIEAELLGLLRQLCEGLESGDYLFPTLPPAEDWADTFRVHLRRAGVDRESLFEDTATVKNITLYDLRATGITWRTLRGDDARIIQCAAGHEKYATTEGYVRAAQVFKGRVGNPFPPLPKEFRSRVAIAKSTSVGKQSGKVASPRGFEHCGSPRNRDIHLQSRMMHWRLARRPAELSPRMPVG